MLCCLILSFVHLFLIATNAQASSKIEVLNKAEELGLAEDPTWLKLLHYDRGSNHSAVLTDSFFLSPEGKTSPRRELAATIGAYFSPWNEDPDEDARCRFPARYYWLAQRLSLPGYNPKYERCRRLSKWNLFNTAKSVSLLLVSGYFGNPASTFGHALLKFNTESGDDESGLFDFTLNYGAAVPENENTLFYVIRGLFGGYKAGFSDKYFYTQDLVYLRAEFRDIWDYKLNLSDYERRLLILHIWEIVGNKFDYYFLDKNCAYRLAELVDLAIEEDLLDNVGFWYFPVDLFHRLKDIDKARRVRLGAGLIQSVHFIPSSQRRLFYQLKLLRPDELLVFNAIVQEGISSMSRHLDGLATERKIFVLDSLLAYQQYRLVAKDPDALSKRRKIKDQILLARLRLPVHPRPYLRIPELVSPAQGSRPMAFDAAIAFEADGGSFLRLAWSPFKQEMVGQNSLEGDELVILDFAVGLSQDEHKVFMDRFDLARIVNLNTLSVRIADESRLSWRLRIGGDRIKAGEKDRYDGVVSFGVGRAWQINQLIIGYGIVDLAGHSLYPYIRLRPNVGVRCDFSAFRAFLYFGGESVDYDGRFHDVWGGKIQYQPADRYAVYLEASNERAARVSLGLNWYF